jgi:hypothetical protein
MAKYEIKTHSTFENVYLIEADSLELAIKKLHNNYDPPDFMQKHLWEDVSGEVFIPDGEYSYTEWYARQKSLGYD